MTTNQRLLNRDVKPVIAHTPIKKACIFGSGAFGTALSTVIGRLPSKPSVMTYHMDADEAAMINKKRENIFFLPNCPLPETVKFTANVAEAIADADIVAIAVPTQYLRKFLISNKAILTAFFFNKPDTPIIVGSKGIEESTLTFPTEIIADVLKNVITRKNLAALAGPNFAGEIALGKFSAAVVASESIETARRVQSMLCVPNDPTGTLCTFRLYASTDVIGCEVASAVKNVVAIGAGAIKGMGHMLNCRAALICRGMAELTALVDRLGGCGYCLQGLAGVGDMLLTCSSEGSRNFSVGLRLGSGESIEKIMANPRAVAEGVATARALNKLAAKANCKMPICDAVYKVLYEKADPHQLFVAITSGPLQDELHCLGLSPTTALGSRLTEGKNGAQHTAADHVRASKL